MGVLKKSFINLLVLSLVLSSVSVYAETQESSAAAAAPAPAAKATPKFDPSKSTPYAAFNTNNFCGKAPEMLEKLNNDNNEKTDKLESLKNQIEDANSYMGIINGVDALKNQYQAGLNEIIKAQSPQTMAEMEADKYKTLDNMKNVIKNGLIINAIGLLFKDSDLKDDNSFKVDSLCKKDNATKQPICTIKQSNAFYDVVKGHPLDPILEKFRIAYRNVQSNNQASLKEDVQKIIDSIPTTIAPSAILGMLETASPGLTAIMASAESKAELTKCLSLKSSTATLAACERLLPETGKTTNFMEQLNKQTNAAVEKIDGFSKIIDESTRANLANFNKVMESYTTQVEAPDLRMHQAMMMTRTMVKEKAKELDVAKLKQQVRLNAMSSLMAKEGQDTRSILLANSESESSKLTGIQTLFYNSNAAQVQLNGQISEQTSNDMEAARVAAEDWEAKCVDPTTIDIDHCQKVMGTISNKVNELKTNYKSKLENLSSEFAKIKTEDDNSYNKIETLKKFVAEKYLRVCTKTSKISMKKERIELGIAVDGKCFSGVHTLNTLDGLGSDVNEIIVNTKFAQTLDSQKDSTGTFTKNEMDKFYDVCRENLINKAYSDVCDEISGEKVQRDKVKDSNEWDAFNEKYWVSYDDKSPKGYSVAKKKSNLRVFGEGVLPIAPQMLPMVFGNYMMRQNIDMMTNQGLYQKQMLHNIGVYNNNPWMYNYNYFGGSGYPYGASTTNTGVNNTTGFGF